MHIKSYYTKLLSTADRKLILRVTVLKGVDKKTLLFVEDEVLIAMSIQIELEKYGYRVIHVNTGEKAVAVSKADKNIDLILMDIDLGKGIDGTTAAEEILSEREMPVVFMSSHTEPEIVEKTEKITSYGYVVKNSGITVLDASIKMAFKLFEANKKIQNELSKRKQAETALHNSDDLMRYIIEHNRNAVIVLDRELRYIYVSKSYLNEFKIKDDNIIGRRHYDVLLNIPKKWKDGHKKALSGEILRSDKDLFTREDGSVEWARWECRPWHENNGLIGGIVIYTEVITDQIKIQESIRYNEDRYRTILANIGDVVAVIGSDRIFKNLSPNIQRWFGWKPEDLIGTDGFVNIHPEDLERIQNEFESLLKKDDGLSIGEFRYKCKNGLYKWIGFTAVNCVKNPFIQGLLLNYHDITESKMIEIDNQRYKHIVDSSTEMIAFTDREYRYVVVNKAYANAFNLFPVDFIGNTVSDIFGEELFFDILKPLIDRCLRGEVFSQQTWYNYPAHGELYIDTTHYPYRDDAEGLIGCVAIVRNITEQKILHDKLVESEANLNSLINNRNDSIFSIDSEYNYVIFNTFYKKVFLSLFNTELKKGMSALDHLAPGMKELWKTKYDKALNGEEVLFEFQDGADGIIHPFECALYPIIKNGKISGVAAITTDITDRKEAADRIQQQLNEKEIILKETHHRIKNNFATIASLLSLQSNALTNSEAVDALNDAIGRVKSMQILYEKLMLTDNYDNTSIEKYLNNLIDNLMQFFPKDIEIKIARHIKDINLDPQKLYAIGLITNELLTNIMKYAFAEREQGVIEVILEENECDVVLIVRDDGNGFTPGSDVKDSNGFGLMLVKMLVQQLDGSFYMEHEKGLSSIIKFSI